MSEITCPQDDPGLQAAEVREMIWALELAAGPEIEPGRAAAIWSEVKRRARSQSIPVSSGFLARFREGLVRGCRQVAATLVQEALAPSPAVRSADVAVPTLLVYETEHFAISLSFSGPPDSTHVNLIGQVVPKVATELPSGGKIAVWSEGDTGFADLDERGEFALESVPRGDLHMDILLGTEAIQISPIHTRVPRSTEG